LRDWRKIEKDFVDVQTFGEGQTDTTHSHTRGRERACKRERERGRECERMKDRGYLCVEEVGF